MVQTNSKYETNPCVDNSSDANQNQVNLLIAVVDSVVSTSEGNSDRNLDTQIISAFLEILNRINSEDLRVAIYQALKVTVSSNSGTFFSTFE